MTSCSDNEISFHEWFFTTKLTSEIFYFHIYCMVQIDKYVSIFKISYPFTSLYTLYFWLKHRSLKAQSAERYLSFALFQRRYSEKSILLQFRFFWIVIRLIFRYDMVYVSMSFSFQVNHITTTKQRSAINLAHWNLIVKKLNISFRIISGHYSQYHYLRFKYTISIKMLVTVLKIWFL